MKKQQLQLAILAAAVVILLAAFFGIRHYNDTLEQASDTKDVERIVDISKDDITKFSYEYDGETYSFEKEDGTWYSVDDHSRNLNQTVIETMLTKLAGLDVVMSIENVTDMSQYGLDEDYMTYEYETAERSYILHIGSKNSVTSVYYMGMPSESTVYAIEYNSLIGSFQRTLDDLTIEDTETTEEAESVESSSSENGENSENSDTAAAVETGSTSDTGNAS